MSIVHCGGGPGLRGLHRSRLYRRAVLLTPSAPETGTGDCASVSAFYVPDHLPRIKDGDPLATLVSGHDKTLLIEGLFDGTTDRSRMGQVRKLWREHLQLPDDEALKAVVRGLRVIDGHRSLDELRSEINVKAQVVGVLACSAADSDFRYDELARQLKVRQLHALTRESLLHLCRDERLLVERLSVPDLFLPIAIRSFLGPAADIVGATPDNTLLLTDDFRQRYLQDDRDWQKDIRPKVEGFLRAAVKKSGRLRLILDAHASIAFLAGAVLDLKSGVQTQLVQKGRVGSRRGAGCTCFAMG